MWRIRAAASLLGISVCVAGAHARPAPVDVLLASVESDRSAYAGASSETAPKRERKGGQIRQAAVGADLQADPPAKPVAEGPGKEILTRKCFQCHQVGMWSSLRQDRKAWEGVLYRMVGRGALWTEAEINAMADFLAQTRGPVK